MRFERPVIDAHLHLTAWNDEHYQDPFSFFEANRLEHGMKAFNICAWANSAEMKYDVSNLMTAALIKWKNPHAYAYGGIYYPEKPLSFPMPEGFDPVTQYEEMMTIGFDGIKMLETKPTVLKTYGIDLASEGYDAFFARCEKDGTHMIWHACDPETFWDIDRIPARHLAKGWYYGDGTYPTLDSIYKMIFTVLDRHPHLKVTFAHFFFCSFRPEVLVELFEKYPNVGVDVTPGAEMYGAFRERRGFYRDFFTRYADRILYGTDTIFGSSEKNHRREDQVYEILTTDREGMVVDIPCRGLDLPDEVCDKILHKNFEKLAGEKPRPINVSALKAYYEKYKSFIAIPAFREGLEKEMSLL